MSMTLRHGSTLCAGARWQLKSKSRSELRKAPMAQTYTQIQRQIEALQKKADKLKQSEVRGVVERIKVAIDHYGLTPDQLFGSGKSGASKAKSAQPTTKRGGAEGATSTTAYVDANGNTWGGRGPRPRWLREALAAGKSLEEFATGSASTKGAAPVAKKKVGKSKGKRTAKTSYRDEGGNAWSGFGPKPGWLKAALAAGRSLEDFAGPPKN